MRKVWIEAALNGAWSRALQPGIPDTIESMQVERAGAAIIHTHAYHNGGSQTFDWQVYARIIEGIREQVEVPVYPSYPAILTSGTDANASSNNVASRFAHIEALAARGLLEFAVIDPGSVNFTRIATTLESRPAGTYLNPEAHMRHALGFAARHGFHPAFAIYEPVSREPAPRSLARPVSSHRSIASCFPRDLPLAFRQSPTPWRPIWHCWKRRRARHRG